jgi:hypothetical protein
VKTTPTFDPPAGTVTADVDVPIEPPPPPTPPGGGSPGEEPAPSGNDGAACKVRIWGHSTDDPLEAWDPTSGPDYDGMASFTDTPFSLTGVSLGSYDTGKAWYLIKTQVYDSDSQVLDAERGAWRVGPPAVSIDAQASFDLEALTATVTLSISVSEPQSGATYSVALWSSALETQDEASSYGGTAEWSSGQHSSVPFQETAEDLSLEDPEDFPYLGLRIAVLEKVGSGSPVEIGDTCYVYELSSGDAVQLCNLA